MYQHIIMLILANLIYLHPANYKCYEATDLLINYAKYFNIQANQASCDMSYDFCVEHNLTVMEPSCRSVTGDYAGCCGHVVTEYWIENNSYYVDPTAWNNWYSTNISIRFKCLNEGLHNWVIN